jgi:tRNA-Thr(GGU) m(6)t(6)A37 methyltransferase TsaA
MFASDLERRASKDVCVKLFSLDSPHKADYFGSALTGWQGGSPVAKQDDELYTFRPIGIIHTAFMSPEGMPIQGALAQEARGWIEIFPKYADGLKDVEGFSHLILLYVFHRSQGYRLIAKPFLEEIPRGLFSIRAPRRPNPIGFTVVKLLGRKDNRLDIAGVDMIDGTPLLDIKPYISDIDAHMDTKNGWISGKMRGDGGKRLSDGRFGK